MEKFIVFAALICFLACASPEVVYEYDQYVVVAVLKKQVFTLSEWQQIKAEIANKYQNLYPDKRIIVTADVTVYYGLKRAADSGDDDSAQYFAAKAVKSA